MSTIALAVGSLEKMPELAPVVQELGRRHVGYGVKDEHYDIVAEVLLWTLDKGLGPDFTPEVKDAWIAVYTTLADAMKSAARKSRGSATPRRENAERKSRAKRLLAAPFPIV